MKDGLAPTTSAGVVVRRRTCRTCDSSDVERVLDIAATPVGDAYVPPERLDEPQPAYPLDVHLCHACGHTQLMHIVDPSVLYGDYIYATSISLGLREHFDAYAAAVLSQVRPKAAALVLDIGSNDGTLLAAFQRRGMTVVGVDPAETIAARATAGGIETFARFFGIEVGRLIRDSRGPAAIVTANNVVANVDDLGAFAAALREVLAPDGVFVFETSYLGDVLEKSLLETVFHEHLSYFTVTALDAYFRREGLELIDVRRVPTKGGSVRGFVQRAGGPRRRSDTVAALMAEEATRRLGEPYPFRRFEARMLEVRERLLDAVEAMAKQGRTVAGYGAAVGTTTLIYHFGVGKLLSFLVDDNPVRHGRFSPGYHLPVLPSAALYDRKADAAIILAWAYAAAILARHGRFREQGGRFVVPLPDVEVL